MKQPYNTTIYNTALYLRLSRDDELQGASGSIQTPVSYTHLDVYKRQVEGRIGRHTFFCAPVVREPEVKPGIF